ESVKEVKDLGDGQPWVERGGLQLDADVPLDLAGVARLLQPEHLHAAGVGVTKTFDDFDGGGLAGAVAAHDADTFPDDCRKADIVDGFGLAVVLAQVLSNDRAALVPHHLPRIQIRLLPTVTPAHRFLPRDCLSGVSPVLTIPRTRAALEVSLVTRRCLRA